MVDKDNKQPTGKGRNLARPNYVAGAKRSQKRLEVLNFDPIGTLVDQYRKLEEELVYCEKVRDGIIVPLNPATGKVRPYNAKLHMDIYDRLIKIGEALLRYGYGRVPETNVMETKRPMPLVVNLTKKGEIYQLNTVMDSEEFDIVDGEYYE